MSIDIPPELQWISYLAGSKWPKGDEDGLWRIGELWHSAAEEMSDLIPDLNRVRNETMSVITGETASTAEQEFAKLFDGDYSVDKLVEAMSALGETARQAGTQVEASKIEILVGLAMAAAEVLYAIAMAPWTFGASMSWIPPIEAITMAAIRMLFKQLMRALVRRAVEAMTKTAVARLIRQAAKESAQEVAEELIVNLSIQKYQIDKGHKDEIDWDDAGKAAKGAAAGGAAAGAFHGPAFGALGGKHGKGGVGNAFAGAGASYGSEVVAGVVGAVTVGGNLDAGEIFAGGALGGLAGGIDSSHGHGADGHGGDAPHGTPTGLDGGKSHAFDSDGKGPDGKGAAKDFDGGDTGEPSPDAPPPYQKSDPQGAPPPADQHRSDGGSDGSRNPAAENTQGSNTAAAGAPHASGETQAGGDGRSGESVSQSSGEGSAHGGSQQSSGGGQAGDAAAQSGSGGGQAGESGSQQSSGGSSAHGGSQQVSNAGQVDNAVAQSDSGGGRTGESGSQQSSGDSTSHGGSQQASGHDVGTDTSSQHSSAVHTNGHDSSAADSQHPSVGHDSQHAPQQHSAVDASAQPAPHQSSAPVISPAVDHHTDGLNSNEAAAQHHSQTGQGLVRGPEPAPHQTAPPADTSPTRADAQPTVSQSPGTASNESVHTDHGSPTQAPPASNHVPPDSHQPAGPPSEQPSRGDTTPPGPNVAASQTNPPATPASPSTPTSPPPAAPPNAPSSGPSTAPAQSPAAQPGPTNTSSTPSTPNTTTPNASGASSSPSSPATHGPTPTGTQSKPSAAGLAASSNSTPTAVSNVANNTASTPTSRATTDDQPQTVVGMVPGPAVAVPPAPPAPPVRGPGKAGPRVGAPPAAPTPVGPRKTDVVNDESWRHDPARSADWFAPRDPAPEQLWRSRRDDAHVRTVDTEVADVLTDSTPTKVEAYDGLVRYDLRRIEVTPGRFVQEYTVKVHLRPGAGVDSGTVADVATRARHGVDGLLNQGFRLPSGDQFHLNLEFTDAAGDAHTVVEVGAGDTDQTHWNPKAPASVLAHETLHYLGVPDEYSDAQRVFLRHDTNSGVHRDDGGMMGRDVLGDDPGLRPRHLWLVERAANSQVSVPDTRLDSDRHPGHGDVHDIESSRGEHADSGRTRPAPKRHWDDDSSDEPDISGPFKRLRTDDAAMDVDSEGAGHPEATHATGSDVEMDDVQHGSDTEPPGRPVELPARDDVTTYNKAFEDLADGARVFAPTKDTHLAALNDSVDGHKPIAFVVNAIVPISEIHQLPEVVKAITADAKGLSGKVAFVIGVNTREAPGAVANLTTALDGMKEALAGIEHPVALTAATWKMPSSGHLPYGTMRNNMMHSSVNEFAIAAMASKGNHPYLAVQDFDTGSRKVPSGEHVFNYVAHALDTGDGLPPSRPLMFGGGYVPPKSIDDYNAMIDSADAKRLARIATLEQQRAQLEANLQTASSEKAKKTVAADLKKANGALAKLEKAGPKLHGKGFREDFARQIEQDMDARVEQAKTSPMLPYTPEPNLFVDAVTTLVDPEVKFGDGGAEFSMLGRSLARFNAGELGDIHDANVAELTSGPVDEGVLAQVENERSNLEVNAQTGRHPIRGMAFVADFKGAAVETDLARIALGYATDGKLPQSHAGLTGVADRFFATKDDKGDTSLSSFRDDFAKRSGADREPIRLRHDPDAPKGTPKVSVAPFTQDQKVHQQLGLTDDSASRATNKKDTGKHNLDTSLSTPVPGHSDVIAGIDQGQPTAKGVAAVNVAMSGPEASTQRRFSSLNDFVTHDFPDGKGGSLYSAPPPARGGLYHAVGEVRGVSASSLRQGLTSHFAGPGGKSVLTDLANFITDNPTTDGDLVKAIIQPGATPLPNLTGLVHDSSAGLHHNPHPDTHPGGGPEHGPLTGDERSESDADTKAHTAKNETTARNAESIAIKALATQLKTTINLHDTATGKTTPYTPFGKASSKSSIELDATPLGDGRHTYSPHQQSTSVRRTRPAPKPEASATSSRPRDAETVRPPETKAEKKERVQREAAVFGDFGDPRVVPVRFEDGKLLGGNSGVHLHEVDGRKVAIKPSRHGVRAVKTELLAQALYRAVGAPTLQATPVLVEGRGSQIHLMSDFLDGKVPDERVHDQFGGHPDVVRFAAADMLLSNWDSHKSDAYILTGRRVVRIDVGGSLDIRAQGEIRGGWTPADVATGDFDVEEIKPGKGMRTKGPFKNLTDAQIADSIRVVADRLTPDAVDAAILKSGYPPVAGADMKVVLQARIDKALEWADAVYPAREIQNQSFGTVLERKPPTALQQLQEDFGYEPTADFVDPRVVEELRSDTAGRNESEYTTMLSVRESPVADALGPTPFPSETQNDVEPPTALQQLQEDFGYEPTADFVDPRVVEELRSDTAGRNESEYTTMFSVRESPVADALGPKRYAFEQKIDATVPEVGPEELFRASQHGDDRLRKRFAEHTAMLDGGVLIRRMSKAEVDSFQIALASDDPIAVEKALFPTPPPGAKWGKRGEIVWSLNDTFTFTRELKPDPVASGSGASSHKAENYDMVLEIPVTPEMAAQLGKNLYISSPVKGAKPFAFQGNPNLKYEGTAGGANNSTGVPNVVIKRNGFADFWSTVRKVRVFDAAAHVSANKYAPPVETKKERALRERNEREAAKDKAAKEATDSSTGLFEGDDDLGLFGTLLDDESSRGARPAPHSSTSTGMPVAGSRGAVLSGGAPPPRPEWTTPTSRDVGRDESWRHAPVSSADWFDPKDAIPTRDWKSPPGGGRDDVPVKRIAADVVDIRSDSAPNDPRDGYRGLIRYDLRRFEIAPGRFVREYTVKLGVHAGGDVHARAEVKQRVAEGVERLLNQGHRLPDGDQFHLNLELVDVDATVDLSSSPARQAHDWAALQAKAGVHQIVRVGDFVGTDQVQWRTDASADVLAHEVLHYLGVPDEYRDASRALLRHDTSSGVHGADGGMMGTDVLGGDAALRPRHLWMVEHVTRSEPRGIFDFPELPHADETPTAKTASLDGPGQVRPESNTAAAELHGPASQFARPTDADAGTVSEPTRQSPTPMSMSAERSRSAAGGTAAADDTPSARKRRVDDADWGLETVESLKRLRVEEGPSRPDVVDDDVLMDGPEASGGAAARPPVRSVLDLVDDDTLRDPLHHVLTPDEVRVQGEVSARLDEWYSPGRILDGARHEADQMTPEAKAVVERAIAEFERDGSDDGQDGDSDSLDDEHVSSFDVIDEEDGGGRAPLSVDFLDIGMGSSTLFVAGDGTTVLIDLGNHGRASKVPAQDGLNFLKDRLEQLRIERGADAPRIDRFYITHADQDHYNLVPSLFAHVPGLEVGAFHIGGKPADYKTRRNVFDVDDLRTMQEIFNDTDVHGYDSEYPGDPQPTLVTTDQGPGTSVSFQVLAANAVPLHGETKKNASSIVVLVSKDADEEGASPLKILMMGDGEQTVEERLVAAHRDLVSDVDVLHIGHHGAKKALQGEFLHVTDPRVAQVSADQVWEHPYAETIERVTEDSTLRVNEAMVNDDRLSIVVGLDKETGHVQRETNSALLVNLSKQSDDTSTSAKAEKARGDKARPMLAEGQQWNVSFRADNSFDMRSTMADQNHDVEFLPPTTPSDTDPAETYRSHNAPLTPTPPARPAPQTPPRTRPAPQSPTPSSGPRSDKGKGRATAEELARDEKDERQRRQAMAIDDLNDALAEYDKASAEVEAAFEDGRPGEAMARHHAADEQLQEARDTAQQWGVDVDVPQPDTPLEPPEVGPSTWRGATTSNSDVDAVPPTPAEQKPDERAAKMVPTAAELRLDPAPGPRLPARDGANLVLGGMDVVESFHAKNQSLQQTKQLVIRHGGQKTWEANRERLTALFSDGGLKPKVAGMLRGGKPVSHVVELGSGRTLSIDLRLDGSPAVSNLRFKENVEEYEFEHSSDSSGVVGSVDEGRRAFIAGAQASLAHPSATHTTGVFGVREHQWSESKQRTDRQISGGQTVEPGTRFVGDIQGVVSYRVSGPGSRTGEADSLPPVSFRTKVTVPTRAITAAVDPVAPSAGPPRMTKSRALTGSDVVTNLQLMPDGIGPHRGPQSTSGLVASPGMRAAFESAYGSSAGRAMSEVDDWLNVELLQANLHGMTNKQPLVHHFEGIGGWVEVHAFVESLGTPSDTQATHGERTSNSADPTMRAVGETSKTEFHYGTETDSARVRQDQITYTAQLPLPGRSRGQGGMPTGEVVGGLDGGLNVGRSTNEARSSQFRNRSTLKNPVPGQAWNGQVRLRFVMHGPDDVSPTQRNGAFKGAVHETRAEFDVLVEKSETTPTADYRGEEVYAPPARIWGRGGPAVERNSATPRSRWQWGRGSRPGAATNDAPPPRERGVLAEPLAGLGSMDRVTNLDLSGFHGMLDSMGHRAFGGKWNKVRPTVAASNHLNRIRGGLPGMTQHSPLITAELAGPGSSSALALTADIENLTYRRTVHQVLSSPSMENTEGTTTTTISTQQISGQAALGGRGGDVAGGPVLGEVIGGANRTIREGDRVREQQRMAVATKFQQPMAIFDGWVRIDAKMTGTKAAVHESGLFPVEIAIPLSELQGSRTHDAKLPPTFDRSQPAGIVATPSAAAETSLAAALSAAESAPLTWDPPPKTAEPPALPAHALSETWQPTDMLIGLDPASGLVEAIRSDLGPALGKDLDRAMAGVNQEFGPQVLQARLAHQSGQQWSHDVPVAGGRITVKVRAIRETGPGMAEYVGWSTKFETDVSVESQSSTARLHDDLTRHVEGGRLVVPFPHGSASVQVTHSGSVLPGGAPSALGDASDLTIPRAETTVTDTEHRIPTRVRTTEAHDLFRQPIRFEISYERHLGARLLSNAPERRADVRLTGVFAYPHVSPAEHGQPGRLATESTEGQGIRLGNDQVVSEVRPPTTPRRAASPTPTEDVMAAHVLDSMTEQGRDVFGDEWPSVRGELAQHVGTRALHGGLGDYSRNGTKTVELRSVRGGKVVLSAHIDAMTEPTEGTAKEAEFYTGGQTIQTATDGNASTDNWNVVVQAQGTVLPVDVGVNASLLGRVDVNRATDVSTTRSTAAATGELFRKKAAAHVQAGTATLRASMSRPTGPLGNGARRERDGLATIDFRIRRPSPDVNQDRYELPDGGLPHGAMVRKILDGDRFRRRTLDNLEAPVGGIAGARLRARIPEALGDVQLQRTLPAMTRGEEVELFRDGPLRVTGRANLTALTFVEVERDGGKTNLLNEVNHGLSQQSSSTWEAGARLMAGPQGNLGGDLRGTVMVGVGGTGRSRHGATYGQGAKVSANGKFAGARAVFDGTAEVVLTVHDGDSSHTLAGVVVHGPMLIPISEPSVGATLSASARGRPPRDEGMPIAGTPPTGLSARASQRAAAPRVELTDFQSGSGLQEALDAVFDRLADGSDSSG